jgi:hypothetical protein
VKQRLVWHGTSARHGTSWEEVLLLRRALAVLAALAVFALLACALAAATPCALGKLYGCAQSDASCGDSVGWAMIVVFPILVPLAVIVAGALSLITYFRVARAKR